ncbi:MAG: hypothetical protein KIS76_06035 [Pyrinomonadaceae bacterium]|nr:hypothetical protein [Pyrinomonadaceae bacterium]
MKKKIINFTALTVFVAAITVILTSFAAAQDATPAPEPTATPTGNQNPLVIETKIPVPTDKNSLTAEQIAESAIFIYGGGLGRVNLDQIRKTTIEKGKLTTFDAKGKSEDVGYEINVIRGENLEKDKFRIDKTFPNAKFAIVWNGQKTFGVYNNTIFTPREDAVLDFQNRIWHGLEALLRYKENGSTVTLSGREKVLGVDFYVLDVTDKSDRKTRFYVSFKSFRVMALEYTESAVKYKRKFYDYNYAQGTLVPYKSVLWADGEKVEEMDIQTIAFGQKVEELLFQEDRAF